ncbi:MAG: FecR family protein [Agriterribacter sp.]
MQKKISPDEHRELMQLIADSGNEDQIMDIIEDFAEYPSNDNVLSQELSDKILNSILPNRNKETVTIKHKKRSRFVMQVAAACLIVISLLGIWFKINHHQNATAPLNNHQVVQIHPGGNKAFLTLDDGTVINLNEMEYGAAPSDSNITVEKNNGILIYKNITSRESNAKYNKLTTPRGGQFQVLLPDGTKVWLNAASSIRYPVAFSAKERVVELTGEAFFKVKKLYKKDKTGRIPFKINVTSSSGDNAVIQVLGTSFNVSAYENENMFKISLKHGSVKVEKGNKTQLLNPGEEAEVYTDNHINLVKNADIEQATAWKNGTFLFENEDIRSIMKQVGRWYDVDVIYMGQYPAARFDGKISRNADISEMLKILKLSGVQFTVTDKTILVQ